MSNFSLTQEPSVTKEYSNSFRKVWSVKYLLAQDQQGSVSLLALWSPIFWLRSPFVKVSLNAFSCFTIHSILLISTASIHKSECSLHFHSSCGSRKQITFSLPEQKVSDKLSLLLNILLTGKGKQ